MTEKNYLISIPSDYKDSERFYKQTEDPQGNICWTGMDRKDFHQDLVSFLIHKECPQIKIKLIKFENKRELLVDDDEARELGKNNKGHHYKKITLFEKDLSEIPF